MAPAHARLERADVFDSVVSRFIHGRDRSFHIHPQQPAVPDPAGVGAAAVVRGGGRRADGCGATPAGGAGGQGYVSSRRRLMEGQITMILTQFFHLYTFPAAALFPTVAAAASALLSGAKPAHAYRDLRMSPETRVVAAGTCKSESFSDGKGGVKTGRLRASVSSHPPKRTCSPGPVHHPPRALPLLRRQPQAHGPGGSGACTINTPQYTYRHLHATACLCRQRETCVSCHPLPLISCHVHDTTRCDTAAAGAGGAGRGAEEEGGVRAGDEGAGLQPRRRRGALLVVVMLFVLFDLDNRRRGRSVGFLSGRACPVLEVPSACRHPLFHHGP